MIPIREFTNKVVRKSWKQRPSASNVTACPLGECDGSGGIFFELEGAQWVRPCPCRRESRARQVLVDAGIPPIYRNVTLAEGNHRDPFKLWGTQAQRGNQVKALAIARETHKQLLAFYHGKARLPPGLFVYGPHGCGKTRLACAMAVDLAYAGIRGIEFLECEMLSSRIAGAIAEGSSEACILTRFQEANLLILDDFNPGEFPYPQKFLSKMGLILTSRYHGQKPTLITSNHNAAKQRRYFGPRMFSRLAEYCRFHYLDCGDYRLFSSQNLSLANIPEADHGKEKECQA